MSLGEDLKNELTQVDGVSKVQVSGVRPREISVVVNRDALSRHNISMGQVLIAKDRQ